MGDADGADVGASVGASLGAMVGNKHAFFGAMFLQNSKTFLHVVF